MEELNKKEIKEIITLWCQGFTIEEIAETVHRSVGAVDNYIRDMAPDIHWFRYLEGKEIIILIKDNKIRLGEWKKKK